MGQFFVNGAQYAIATVVGAAVPISAISNANPGVASAASTPTTGDIVLIDSNWSSLIGQAVRAANVVANTSFELEGVDTTDTNQFPAGEGAGSYKPLSSFVSLSQIRSVQQQGGDFNDFSWSYVEDRALRQRSRPTDANPVKLTFTLDYDPSLPWFAALESLTKKQTLTAMRETLPDGTILLYTGYIAFQSSPTRTRNENMTVTAVMTINSDIIRYEP